jgi:Post-segregation antitoxin (ccd killing mechanism protein) encoded by the F plasmid
MSSKIAEAAPNAYRSGKRRLNLSVRGDLIDRARRAGLNLSRVFEDSLSQRLREEEGRRWLEENREAIEHHRKRIERDGPWNKDLIRF